MTSSRRNLTAGAAAMLLCVFAIISDSGGTRAQEPDGNFGVGVPSVFLPKYLRYRAQQLNSGTPDVLRIRLGYVKGLSRSFTAMVGEAAVNLQSGAFNVSLNGLTPLQTYTVWLVDRPESDLVPDTVVGLVSFLAAGPSKLLTGLLPLNLPLGFTIDRVEVKPGALFSGGPLAAGSLNVFQKMFFRRLSLVNESTGVTLFQETTPAPALAALVPDLAAQTDALSSSIAAFDAPPTLGFASEIAELTFSLPPESSESAASSGGSVKLDKLISQGARLFFEETFEGNGRTCGTCHPSSNNFTIDKKFIDTLPPDDPLFVAENNPALEKLEKPALMRSDALILENVDGLESPETKFLMRGVPHTLGLQVSLERDTNPLFNPPAPSEMTGWSGDGSPGTGSLREFAIGAVTQHFTKSLERVAGQDFELPSEHQLDAMEAFQLSLGREADFILANITFTDPNVNTGKDLFINGDPTDNLTGTCNFCHRNAGALAVAPAGQNRNFDTNVEARDHPARNGSPDVLDPNFPFDGGLGTTPPNPNPRGIFGNGTFNTASVVEAADTAPFFHNNVERTLLAAVEFYSGDEFNAGAGAGGFDFDDTENDQIADFLRGINTLQNIDVGKRELKEILDNKNNPRNEQNKRLQTAFDETQDAIDVLTAPEAQGLFVDAVPHLNTAQGLILQALLNTNPDARRALVVQAIAELGNARNEVEDPEL